ncbi:MAG: hypothetical protein LBB88_08310 [Planctomycetaceae bacterium]|jgi:hypothetical protein|nr:hypothetical protein [Planctomycetaceae bacterium]
MTNNKLNPIIRQIVAIIFVSIICLCIVTTNSAQNRNDDKNKKSNATKSQNNYRQPASSKTPSTRSAPRSAPPRSESRATPPRRSESRTTSPRTESRSTSQSSEIRSKSQRSEVRTTPPRSESRPTTTRRIESTKTINSTAKKTPTQSSQPTQTQPKISTSTTTKTSTTSTTSTSTPKVQTETAAVTRSEKPVDKTAKKTETKLPTFRRSNQTITASGKVETRKLPENASKNQTVRTSDLLRRSKTSSANSRANNDANNRSVNDRVIAPSPNRVGGLRTPPRKEEIAKAIIKSNQLKNSPQHHRQPPPSVVKNVRKNFRGYNDYWTGDWYRRHPKSWRPIAIPNHAWWRRPYWKDTCNWFDTAFFAGIAINNMLHTYDYYPYYYGSNIAYYGDMVYVNGVPYVSATEYYRQALNLARTADALIKAESENSPQVVVINQQPPEQTLPEQTTQINQQNATNNDGWLPMGTFAFLDSENENNIENINANENNSQILTREILQIATNKVGQIRGNFVDEKNNTIRQMIGAIDPKTQRVALRFVDDNTIVWECGLWNLTQDTVPILIHSGESKFEQKTLIRLLNDTDSDAEINPVTGEIELAP